MSEGTKRRRADTVIAETLPSYKDEPSDLVTRLVKEASDVSASLGSTMCEDCCRDGVRVALRHMLEVAEKWSREHYYEGLGACGLLDHLRAYLGEKSKENWSLQPLENWKSDCCGAAVGRDAKQECFFCVQCRNLCNMVRE